MTDTVTFYRDPYFDFVDQVRTGALTELPLALVDPHDPDRLIPLGRMTVSPDGEAGAFLIHGRVEAPWRAYRQYFGHSHPRARRVKTEYHRRRR